MSSALASEHDGAHPTPEVTRARIMARLAAEQQRKKRRWILWTPLLALGIGSTALAASGGSLVSALASIPEWFTSRPPSERGSDSSRARAPAHARSKISPVSEPSEPQPAREETPEAPEDTPETSEPTPPAPGGETAEEPPSLPQPKAASALARGQADESRSSQNAHAPPAPVSHAAVPSETPRPAESLGLDVYRKAHEAQFRGRDCKAALEGYAAYLREHPGGALQLEASYNTALCEIELGLVARARRSLSPFASGAYGAYRQEEARALLEALDAQTPQ